MVRTWVDTATERHHIMRLNTPCEDAAAWLPDPPERNVVRFGRAQRIIRMLLALAIFGTVFPSDLYLANGFLGTPIPALRDPMVINAFVTLSVALAVPVIPLALLAILLHLRYAAIGQRQGFSGSVHKVL